MKTIDIHTHLLSPEVSFDRFYDRIAMRPFGKGLGIDYEALARNPYVAYVSALTNSVRNSQQVEKLCLFGVDSRLDHKGREIHRDKTVCATTEDVLDVANEYADCIIPFFSINPLRPNALELIDEYIERGCKGAKFLQIYWGVDLNDPRFGPYYEKLKEKGIPLIIHIGSEYSIDSFAEYERIEMLRQPLEAGVKVIAAHMGLERVEHKAMIWRNLSKKPAYFDKDYYRLLELLGSEENLYADISAILAPLRARALRHLSEQTQVHHKLLFGTDYPVPFTVSLNTYDMPRTKRRKIKRIENPFDRYTAAIMEYFPEGHGIYSRCFVKNTYLENQGCPAI
ncbi:amidohydrolase family protein [Solemya velesiana gill symbiont]|uniref:Mannonate dehydratase n=1 Tax=Solemya velesiana gill symbiont TaxID=1918948 RepID=A0A1T2KWN1_9GAMM|nr:amidohydrolase family protein [Solemya velesiana gill symbiont]OOZ37156.1 mannonate dehydratase [Solemya velesiana gill symbiont]